MRQSPEPGLQDLAVRSSVGKSAGVDLHGGDPACRQLFEHAGSLGGGDGHERGIHVSGKRCDGGMAAEARHLLVAGVHGEDGAGIVQAPEVLDHPEADGLRAG